MKTLLHLIINQLSVILDGMITFLPDNFPNPIILEESNLYYNG
ncbi:MAG: hypothetical protein RLZ10_1638 [Bacteroidota bacterium]|jgi:hypothetical protein